MKFIFSALPTLSLTAFAAVDPAKDLWFLADFDSPAQVDGAILPQEPDSYGYTEGKFGRGYWFFPSTNNRLTQSDIFLNDPGSFSGKGLEVRGDKLGFRGGTFKIAERPSHLEWWWSSNEGTGIWSFYVKAKAGTRLTLTPTLTPEPKGAKKAALANKNIKNYNPETAQPDVIRTNSFVLAEGWQRVWASFALDRCTAGKRCVSLDVTSTGPIVMRQFQYQTMDGGSKKHTDPRPGVWVDGGAVTSGKALVCKEASALKNFPYEEGACAFWVKDPQEVPSKCSVWVWGLQEGLNYWWGLENNFFGTGPGRLGLRLSRPIPRTNEWTHVAVTWSGDRLAYFINGKCVSETEMFKKAPIAAESFSFGCCPKGGQPRREAAYDDFAIFRRALTDEEVAELAKATTPLAGSRSLCAGRPTFLIFPRNVKNAALCLDVWSSAPFTGTLESSVGGIAGRKIPVSFTVGKSALRVPFDATRLNPGERGYSWTVKDKGGSVVLSQVGTLTIQKRLAEDPFLFMSWGGGGRISDELLATVGINCVNVDRENEKDIRKVAARGDYVNLRYANHGIAAACGYAPERVAARAEKDFSFAAGLDHWRLTLVNTEAYGLQQAREAAKGRRYADALREALGCEPDFNFQNQPPQVGWPKGVKPPVGVIRRGAFPALSTLEYLRNEGHPLFGSNRATTEAIHGVKSDVCVWSEPLWGGVAGSVDMGADWLYELTTKVTLLQIRSQYANCRRHGRPYMPTLGASYWPAQSGTHPMTMKKVTLAQSADETVIKAWIALGAVPTHNLSFFGLNAWQSGPENARKYLKDPSAAFDNIAEPDAPERFGAAWRTDLAPAADLLRDMTNVSAKVALMRPQESNYAGNLGWAPYNYLIAHGLAGESPAFDVVSADDSVETLSGYRYIVMPMAKVVYEDHAAKLRQIADRGTVIVQDSYASVHYPNEVVLTNAVYRNGKYREMSEMLLPWYGPCVPGLQATAGACSDGDGKTSYTFEKRHGGVRYVTVVNNLRTETNTFVNAFRTNNYHVVGAPQKIVTTIRDVPSDGEVLLFNAHGRVRTVVRKGTTVEVAGEFAPAEGCVYVVAPQKPTAPKLSLEGRSLFVRIEDANGRPFPGRTVVEVVLADEKGAARDESGRYVVENGCRSVPIIVSDADRDAFESGRWTVTVTDLASGLSSGDRKQLKECK